MQDAYIQTNIYLPPPSHPSRRKSPVFLLLFLATLATVAVFVLCISRLGRELRAGTLEAGGPYKLFTIGYVIVITIFSTIYMSLTLSFFKSVYPPPGFSSSYRELKGSQKATIIGNYFFAVLWASVFGIQLAEKWITIDGKNYHWSTVESDARKYLRIALSALVTLAILVLGWYSGAATRRRKNELRREVNRGEELALR